MVFKKTLAFVFHEIGLLWSLLQIKFPNLHFKDFLFFRIFVNILQTKNLWSNIFLFGNFYEDFEFFSENFFVCY